MPYTVRLQNYQLQECGVRAVLMPPCSHHSLTFPQTSADWVKVHPSKKVAVESRAAGGMGHEHQVLNHLTNPDGVDCISRSTGYAIQRLN